MAPEKQIMHNFLPFLRKGEVLNTGSTEEFLERIVALAPSSTSISIDMFSSKPASVCIFLFIEKKTSHLNVKLIRNDRILILV